MWNIRIDLGLTRTPLYRVGFGVQQCYLMIRWHLASTFSERSICSCSDNNPFTFVPYVC
jgi:hypothetical protein